MNWDAIGAIGEIVGAGAVVVSLLYLAVQTRENAKSLKANALWNAETIFGEVNYSHGSNPEWALLLNKAFNPEAKASDFSEAELSQVQFTIRGAMQYFQAQWVMCKEGILPESFWMRRRQFVRDMIEAPLIGKLWQEEVQNHIIDEEFRKEVESLLPVTQLRMIKQSDSDT